MTANERGGRMSAAGPPQDANHAPSGGVEVHTSAADLGKALEARGWSVATAESCTGGLIAGAITDVPGSSAWFDRGYVTYSNAAKLEMLGVRAETLEEHGAVSEATAREMATGALARSMADLAVAVTGVAGPSGGSPDKPVGMVCLAWATRLGTVESETRHYAGDRQDVRRKTVAAALTGLLEHARSDAPAGRRA